MLKVFGLEAPCYYETDRTLAKKLHLKEIAAEKAPSSPRKIQATLSEFR